MTLIVDTKCEEGDELPGDKGGQRGGLGGGLEGVGGRHSEEAVKLEPGLLWPHHPPPPPQYLPPKTEIKVISRILQLSDKQWVDHLLEFVHTETARSIGRKKPLVQRGDFPTLIKTWNLHISF